MRAALRHLKVGESLDRGRGPDLAARLVGVGQRGVQVQARLVIISGLRGCMTQHEVG